MFRSQIRSPFHYELRTFCYEDTNPYFSLRLNKMGLNFDVPFSNPLSKCKAKTNYAI